MSYRQRQQRKHRIVGLGLAALVLCGANSLYKSQRIEEVQQEVIETQNQQVTPEQTIDGIVNQNTVPQDFGFTFDLSEGAITTFRIPKGNLELNNEEYNKAGELLKKLGHIPEDIYSTIDRVIEANKGTTIANIVHDGNVRHMAMLNPNLNYEQARTRYMQFLNTKVQDDVVECGIVFAIGKIPELDPEFGNPRIRYIKPEEALAIYTHSIIYVESEEALRLAGARPSRLCDY